MNEILRQTQDDAAASDCRAPSDFARNDKDEMKSRSYYVYIMTNKWNTTLYIGVTNNLIRRVFEHKEKTDPKSFTARYNLDKLVYFEQCDDAYVAISREKQLKGGSRKKKLDVVLSMNPDWKDIAEEICS